MLTKIYWYSWIVFAIAFLLLTVAGSMTMTALVVFGFVAFGMIFMGMIAVLPSSISHPVQSPAAKVVEQKRVAVDALPITVKAV